jgi:hypothetical protein
MMRRRSWSVKVAQCAISCIVRQQPMHNPVLGSIEQTFVQGLSIGLHAQLATKI